MVRGKQIGDNMPAFLTSMTPAILASALTMAYPVPFGQPVTPSSLPNPASEIVDIDQDRAERMTVPVSIEGSRSEDVV